MPVPILLFDHADDLKARNVGSSSENNCLPESITSYIEHGPARPETLHRESHRRSTWDDCAEFIPGCPDQTDAA